MLISCASSDHEEHLSCRCRDHGGALLCACSSCSIHGSAPCPVRSTQLSLGRIPKEKPFFFNEKLWCFEVQAPHIPGAHTYSPHSDSVKHLLIVQLCTLILSSLQNVYFFFTCCSCLSLDPICREAESPICRCSGVAEQLRV